MFKHHVRKWALTAVLASAVVGTSAAGVIAAHAQPPTPPVTTELPAAVPDTALVAETPEADAGLPDTDLVDEQVGDQIEDGLPDSAEAPEADAGLPDTDLVDEQVGDQSAVDAAGAEAPEADAGLPDTDNVQDGDQSGDQVEDGQPDLPNAAPEAPGQ